MRGFVRVPRPTPWFTSADAIALLPVPEGPLVSPGEVNGALLRNDVEEDAAFYR
jgi:hypothetical protein